jgi:hypothetical protein
MRRFSFLAGMVAVGGLIVMAMTVAPQSAMAGGRLGNGPNYGTLDGYGNGTATDDKSGVGCQDPNYPNLVCPVGDYCSCLTSTGAAFKGIGNLPGTLDTEINFDFSNNTNLYGTPNGSGGYCFGASGVATATANNGDHMNLTLQGNVCDAIPVGTAPNQVFGAAFTGNYSITGGTGRFTGQAGTGTFSEVVSDVNSPNAPATFTAVGSSGH